MLTSVPWHTTLTNTSLNMTVLTVDIWTRTWTVRSIIPGCLATFNRVNIVKTNNYIVFNAHNCPQQRIHFCESVNQWPRGNWTVTEWQISIVQSSFQDLSVYIQFTEWHKFILVYCQPSIFFCCSKDYPIFFDNLVKMYVSHTWNCKWSYRFSINWNNLLNNIFVPVHVTKLAMGKRMYTFDIKRSHPFVFPYLLVTFS